MTKLQLNDIGTTLIMTIVDYNGDAVDISAATKKQLKIQNPAGVTAVKTADFVDNGSDGKIKYVIVADDLSTKGIYKLQGYIEISTNKYHTDVSEFEVVNNL